MQRHWRVIAVLIAMAATVSLSIAITAQTPPETTTTVSESGDSITGAFEGWYRNMDGTFSLLMGYFNRNSKQVLDIPVGPSNRIEPGGPDQGQPTHFLPRRQWGVFRIVVPKDFGDKKLSWTIVANGKTTSIPISLNPLWVVEPFKDAGNGNTPPVLKFEPEGTGFTGPPHGIARSLTAKLGTPLSLVLWYSDDRPMRGARGGTGPVFWSMFRGAGSVTFENERPAPDAQGKTVTSAKFSAPGDYILRAQAIDATGEGGGGFQCCWTNVHVKVTVSPESGN